MSKTSRVKLIHHIVLLTVVAFTATALMGIPSLGTAKVSSADVPSRLTTEDAIKLVTSRDGALRFDVAENLTLFAWSGEPELRDGLPVHRTAYVSQGYIYPEGTLTDTNGVLPDGSPEFPDKVLGQWSCWGWYIGAGAPPGSASWLATHLFNFGSEWGEATVMSEGYGIDAQGVQLERAVTGGTGPYAGARGVQRETLLGFNASNGANSRYEIRLVGP